MAKIICNDGTEEYLTPGAAREKVAAGEARYPAGILMYTTRHLVAETPETKKVKRKRRSKAEMEADAAESQVASDETE
jgi:hypothetical protein